MQTYISKLADISVIEGKTYDVSVDGNVVSVKFLISEFPNDMKMIAFLGGELNNSAKYFSSFADVSTDNGNKLDGSFGNKQSDTWKPCKYSHRLPVVKEVNHLKKQLEKKKLVPATKRNKITSLISSKKANKSLYL